MRSRTLTNNRPVPHKPLATLWETLALMHSSPGTTLRDHVQAFRKLPAIGGRRPFRMHPVKIIAIALTPAVCMVVFGAMAAGVARLAGMKGSLLFQWAFVGGVVGSFIMTGVLANEKRQRSLTAALVSSRLALLRLADRSTHDDQVYIARAVEARRETWKRMLASTHGMQFFVGLTRLRPVWGAAAGLVFMLPLLLMMLTRKSGASWGPMMLLTMMIGAIVAIALTVYVMGRRFRKRILGAIEDGACPDCGYGVAGALAGKENFPELGPRFCPECEARWPLVPPAAPMSKMQQLEQMLKEEG